MPTLQIMTRLLQDRSATISLKGHLDKHTHKELERVIFWLFGQRIYNFTVDLSGLKAISFEGVSVVFALFGMARKHNGNLVILRPNRGIRRVLNLFGLNRILPIKQELSPRFTRPGLVPSPQVAVC